MSQATGHFLEEQTLGSIMNTINVIEWNVNTRRLPDKSISIKDELRHKRRNIKKGC